MDMIEPDGGLTVAELKEILSHNKELYLKDAVCLAFAYRPNDEIKKDITREGNDPLGRTYVEAIMAIEHSRRLLGQCVGTKLDGPYRVSRDSFVQWLFDKEYGPDNHYSVYEKIREAHKQWIADSPHRRQKRISGFWGTVERRNAEIHAYIHAKIQERVHIDQAVRQLKAEQPNLCFKSGTKHAGKYLDEGSLRDIYFKVEKRKHT